MPSLDNILDPVAAYLNFLIQFAQFQGMTNLVLKGQVDTTALSILFVGLIFAIVIVRAQSIGLHNDVNPGAYASSEFKIEFSKLMGLATIAVLAALPLHGGFLVHGIWSSQHFGSLEDTLNGNVVATGIYYPLFALSLRTKAYTESLSELGGFPQMIGGIFQMVIGLMMIGFTAYWFWAIGAAHGLKWTEAIIPIGIGFLLSIICLLPIWYLIGIKILADQEKWN